MKGHYFFFGILMIFLISMPILIIWDWNKNRELPIKELLKNFGDKRKIYIGIFVVFAITEFFIPLNKDRGIEFNSERRILGIPELKVDWKKDKAQSGKFTTYWWKPKLHKGHFKKVIEYGILNAKTETDYYNVNGKGTFAWSKYDFRRDTFEYFIEKPNNKRTSFTESGKLKIEKLTIIEKVEKSEFEKYVSE